MKIILAILTIATITSCSDAQKTQEVAGATAAYDCAKVDTEAIVLSDGISLGEAVWNALSSSGSDAELDAALAKLESQATDDAIACAVQGVAAAKSARVVKASATAATSASTRAKATVTRHGWTFVAAK